MNGKLVYVELNHRALPFRYYGEEFGDSFIAFRFSNNPVYEAEILRHLDTLGVLSHAKNVWLRLNSSYFRVSLNEDGDGVATDEEMLMVRLKTVRVFKV